MKSQVYRFLTITLFLSLTGISISANHFEIRQINDGEITKAIVLDKETGKPIEYAEAFVSGSTVFAVTDDKGFFQLELPYLPCYLIVTHKNYEPFAFILDKKRNSYNIELEKSKMDSINVNAKGRNKDIRFFYQQFIGDANRSVYKILNDNELSFSRDDYSFNAVTNSPLEILNNHLGYRIRVLIREFEIKKINSLTKESVPLNAYSGTYTRRISGHYYYIPITTYPENRMKKVEMNRKNLYYGSYRHFFKALYDGEVMEQGYQLNFFPQEAVRNGIVMRNTGNRSYENQIKEFTINADSLQILFYSDAEGNPISLVKPLESFNKKTSIIYPTYMAIKIRPNGTCPNIPFEMKGPMNEYYFVNFIPDDYYPE